MISDIIPISHFTLKSDQKTSPLYSEGANKVSKRG